MELADLSDCLQQECQMAPGRKLVVGVSGGADSLCLLDSLHRLEYSLVAVHFDHGLRAESAQDAEKVAEMARKMGIPFRTIRRDVRDFAQSTGLSLEEAARKARYSFLFEQARLLQADAVAVAHTADDQVETVLMHLLRGAGLGGLRGMNFYGVLPEWDATIPLIRPLLQTWRRETEAWCALYDLTVLNDPSNLDPTFFRNRLRHELIPYLRGYNPNVKEVIWRMARVLAGDWEVLAHQVDQAWQHCWIEDGPGWVVLELAQLQDLIPGLQRGVLRKAIDRMRPGLRDVDFDSVERALEWLKDPPRGRWWDLTAGLTLWVEWGRIYVTETHLLPIDENWPQMLPGSELILPVPGEVQLANGWRIAAEWEIDDNPNEAPAERYILGGEGLGRLELVARVDGDRLQLPLRVRGMRPGERLTPLGMAGHSLKLSDFYTNRKLPQRARAEWPLVISGDEIAWLAGLRISEPFKVHDHTRRVVRLNMRRI